MSPDTSGLPGRLQTACCDAGDRVRGCIDAGAAQHFEPFARGPCERLLRGHQLRAVNVAQGSGPASQPAELVARDRPVELRCHAADVRLDRALTRSRDSLHGTASPKGACRIRAPVPVEGPAPEGNWAGGVPGDSDAPHGLSKCSGRAGTSFAMRPDSVAEVPANSTAMGRCQPTRSERSQHERAGAADPLSAASSGETVVSSSKGQKIRR